jgi:hypothetical protein
MEETIMRQPVINIDETWNGQVFEMIAGIRSLAQQIATDIRGARKALAALGRRARRDKEPLVDRSRLRPPGWDVAA